MKENRKTPKRKAPTDKRTDGVIYSFEKRDEHQRAKELVRECERKCMHFKYLSKDKFGNPIENIITKRK
jgi:hypothetical protein